MDTPYDLLDQTNDLLAGDPNDGRKHAVKPLREWQAIVRELGFPSLAYDLEQLEIAIEKADAGGIKAGLTRVAHQTHEAAQETDGPLRTKLGELVAGLKRLASEFGE